MYGTKTRYARILLGNPKKGALEDTGADDWII
jgi:hypothetical protein